MKVLQLLVRYKNSFVFYFFSSSSVFYAFRFSFVGEIAPGAAFIVVLAGEQQFLLPTR